MRHKFRQPFLDSPWPKTMPCLFKSRLQKHICEWDFRSLWGIRLYMSWILLTWIESRYRDNLNIVRFFKNRTNCRLGQMHYVCLQVTILLNGKCYCLFTKPLNFFLAIPEKRHHQNLSWKSYSRGKPPLHIGRNCI